MDSGTVSHVRKLKKIRKRITQEINFVKESVESVGQ